MADHRGLEVENVHEAVRDPRSRFAGDLGRPAISPPRGHTNASPGEGCAGGACADPYKRFAWSVVFGMDGP